MRTEPCNQCGSFDWYERGTFSYCRPCHSEAQRRYVARKAAAEDVELVSPPNRPLHQQSFNLISPRLTCKNGHPVNSENVRVSSQRKGTNLFRRCRACERNAKRVAYGLPAEVAPIKLSTMLDQVEDS